MKYGRNYTTTFTRYNYSDCKILNLLNLFSPSYYPFQAFTNKNSWWGGRKNSEGVFEIGGETRYPTGQTLTVEMIQNGNTHAVTQVIENLLKASGNSVKLLVEKNGKWDELCILKIKQGITMSCTAKFR